MNTAKKKQLGIRLKRALKTAKEAHIRERELAELTEEIFGCNWSDVDADGIIDSISGFGSMELTTEEFIDEMNRSIKMKND